ncbi:hypothetical protein [Umezawaea sp. NPDC059074]|uniref:hypothetical protein n=1 Tax=Umezawaea sp. NPDC059074 TaxID=3346716 RepID=UPI0036B80E24
MQPLIVRRVLGDGPFAEIGDPLALVEHGDLVAVGGHVSWLQRIGMSAAGRGWKPHAIGVYDRADLRCRFLVRSRYPVRSMAFHPRSPLLAIGTGSYDGGMSFHGELLLLNLDTGEVVSALESGPEVRVVVWRAWRDGQVLDLAVSPYSDEELGRDSYTVGFDAMVVREDWTAVRDGEIGRRELDGPMRESGASASAEEARARVVGLCPEWAPRRDVWAVEHLPDGRVLAALDGARVECWSAAGEREWAVVDGSVGQQLDLAPESVWCVARVGWGASVGLHSLRDGKPLDPPDPRVVDLLTARAEHRIAVRHGSAWYFRHSPDHDVDHFVLSLRDVRVATATPDGLVRLFPLDWTGEHRRTPWCGPAVEVAGALVLTGVSIDGPPRATLVRRRLPGGEVDWHTHLDHQVTAVEVSGAVLYAALDSGALLALDVGTGEVLREHALVVNGHPTVGLSLASAGPGRLLVGTVDGRVLELHQP